MEVFALIILKSEHAYVSAPEGRKYGNTSASGTLILQICNANYVNI